MLKNYLKITLRNILRHKGYSLINILGLAVGIACCVVILQQIRYELSYDSFHTKADRIYRLNIRADFTGESTLNAAVSSGPSAPSLMEQFPEVENFARTDFEYTKFYEREKKIQIDHVLFADNSLLELFDFKLISGDRSTALLEPYTAVVTEETAHKLFGNDDPIGKILKGKKEYRITGVLKNIPGNSHLQFDMLLSMAEKVNKKSDNIHVWQTFNFRSYLLLNDKADPKVLESKLPEFVQQHFSALTGKIELYLQPLQDVHLHSTDIQYDNLNSNKSDIAYVYIFASIALVILLIACINFMNLSTARSARRATEVGIRKVVGANRRQLIYQFIGESLIIVTFALLVAVVVIEITRPVLSSFFNSASSIDILDDWTLLIVYIGIIISVSLLAGGYPAFILSTFRPKETSKGFTNPGGKGEFLRKLLVASQFVVAIILLTGAVFIGRQMQYIQNKNLGYNKEQVIVGSMSGPIRRNFDTFRDKLMQNPAITAVTASEFNINGIQQRSLFRIKGDPQDMQRMATNMRIDYNFLSFWGLKLIEGRDFSRKFASDIGESGGYIINETLRNQIGWKTAVGKKIGRIDPASSGPDNLGTVIGVVKDFNFASLHDKISPLFLYMTSGKLDRIAIRIRPEHMKETLAFLKEEWTKFAHGQAFDVNFLDDDFAASYKNEEQVGKIVEAFTALAIFVTCLGLLGLISFSAERRTKEIGIRKTLGATTRSIIVLLTKEIGQLVIIANLIALPIAWYVIHKWLQNFAYRVEMSWWMFVLSGGIALVIALATVSFQAIKAATANPVESLRYE